MIEEVLGIWLKRDTAERGKVEVDAISEKVDEATRHTNEQPWGARRGGKLGATPAGERGAVRIKQRGNHEEATTKSLTQNPHSAKDCRLTDLARLLTVVKNPPRPTRP